MWLVVRRAIWVDLARRGDFFVDQSDVAGGGELLVRRREGEKRKIEGASGERRPAGRRKVARRRQIDPTTCERDYSADELEFMQAMDAYKRSSGRMFPTCSEILEVVRALGYKRPDQAAEAGEVQVEGGVSDAALVQG